MKCNKVGRGSEPFPRLTEKHLRKREPGVTEGSASECPLPRPCPRHSHEEDLDQARGSHRSLKLSASLAWGQDPMASRSASSTQKRQWNRCLALAVTFGADDWRREETSGPPEDRNQGHPDAEGISLAET